MTDVKDGDGPYFRVNLVNDTLVSDPYPVSSLRCLQFLAALRERITAQRFDNVRYSLQIPLADSAHIMFHRPGQNYPIGVHRLPALL